MHIINVLFHLFCTQLNKKITGNGLMYQFNPIDGSAVNGGLTELNYPIRQISVLQPGTDFLHGILLLDRNNGVHIFPESATETVTNIQFQFQFVVKYYFSKRKVPTK